MAANLQGPAGANDDANNNNGAEEIIFIGEEPHGNAGAAGGGGRAAGAAAHANPLILPPGPLPLGQHALFALDRLNNNNIDNAPLLLPPNNNNANPGSIRPGGSSSARISGAPVSSAAGPVRPNNYRYMPYRSLRNAAQNSANAKMQQIVCRRKARVRTIKFEYLIDSFSFFKDSRGPVHDVIESPTFPSEESQYKWKLRFIVHPRPERPSDEQCRDFVQVFLNLYDAPCDSVSVKVQLIMARSKDAVVDLSYQITRAREYRRGETWGFRRFIQREHIFNRNYGFLHDDQLRFICNIEVQTQVEHLSHCAPAGNTIRTSAGAAGALRPENLEDSSGNTSWSSLDNSDLFSALNGSRVAGVGAAAGGEGLSVAAVNNYKRLLESGRFADCTLEADDGQTIRVHKAIVAAHSEVLANALESGMREAQNATVRIGGDVPFEVVQEFVAYLYTSQCVKLEEYAEDLFVLADTHFVAALKTETRDCLMSTLELNNAVRRLRLADMHSDSELRQCVLDFIEDNFARIRASDSWKELVEHKPKLAAQALEHMYDRFNPLPSEESNQE